jgi:hypothetical protein
MNWKFDKERDCVKLELSKLGSRDLKELSQAVKTEQDRRGKRNPANHEPPTWTVPNEAIADRKTQAA